MAMQEYTLSETALQALNEILPDADFGAGAPSLLLDDALSYLSELTDLSEGEAWLKAELEAMPDQARQSISRALAAARRTEEGEAMEPAAKEPRGLGAWMAEHKRIMYLIFLALAALNGWISYRIFDPHPLLALANAAMAAFLVLWVIFTW